MTLTYPDSPAMNESIPDSITRAKANFDYLNENLLTKTSKLHTAGRIMTAASGDVVYTVTGITPKCIIVYAVEASTDVVSFGFIDEDGLEYCICRDYNGDWAASTTTGISITTAAGKSQTAVWTSYAADTFTLTWTKTGLPTETISLIFLVLA